MKFVVYKCNKCMRKTRSSCIIRCSCLKVVPEVTEKVGFHGCGVEVDMAAENEYNRGARFDKFCRWNSFSMGGKSNVVWWLLD